MNEQRTTRNEFGLPNVVIPAEVLVNKNLTSTEMILFGYISNMTYNGHGYCWASNCYLSRLLHVRSETISRMIVKLVKEGYLLLDYEVRFDGAKIRKIFINKEYPQKYSMQIQEELSNLKKTTKIIKDINENNPQGEGNLLTKTSRPIDENINDPCGKYQEVLTKTSSNIDNYIDNNTLSDPKETENKCNTKRSLTKDKQYKKRESFSPPTIQEIQDYIDKQEYEYVSAEEFYYFYESKDWYVGKNKMKKWRQAVAGWNARKKQAGSPPLKKKEKDVYQNIVWE